jgi:hypothetical protein
MHTFPKLISEINSFTPSRGIIIIHIKFRKHEQVAEGKIIIPN